MTNADGCELWIVVNIETFMPNHHSYYTKIPTEAIERCDRY